MNSRKPMYTLREANLLITTCRTLDDLEIAKELLLDEMNNYCLPDQGFLLTMMGLQVIKMTDKVTYRPASIDIVQAHLKKQILKG